MRRALSLPDGSEHPEDKAGNEHDQLSAGAATRSSQVGCELRTMLMRLLPRKSTRFAMNVMKQHDLPSGRSRVLPGQLVEVRSQGEPSISAHFDESFSETIDREFTMPRPVIPDFVYRVI